MTRVVFYLIATLLAYSAGAQEAQPLGPQSGLEQYDAPVIETSLPEGAIDFPAMINAPGANDGQEILSSLDALKIEFIDGNGDGRRGSFVRFSNNSKITSEQFDLYAEIREKLAIYRNLPLTLGDLRFIQQDIAEVYRNHGYPLMSVVVPPQEVTDNLINVQINEFRLVKVNLQWGDGSGSYQTGGQHWTNWIRYEPRFDKLKNLPIISQAILDKEVALLNRNPFRSARVVFEPGGEVGGSVMNVQIDEKRPYNLQASYNNHATESSGEHRFSVGGSFGNVPVEDHQLSWNATFGTNLEEFSNYSLIYTVPVGFDHSFSVNLNYSDTASSSIPGIDSASTTLQSTVRYKFSLMSGLSWDLSGNVAASLRQFERASLFGGVNVGAAAFDGINTTFGAVLKWRQDTVSNQLSANIIRSLKGITGNNTDANFQSFHNSFTGNAGYTFYNLNYARVVDLQDRGWRLETQVSMQYASDELAGADSFSLGGANVLRAYQSSEASGDRGGYITQTVYFPAFKSGPLSKLPGELKPALFVEFGKVISALGGGKALWDAGASVSFTPTNMVNCNASLAIAGEHARLSEQQDVRFYTQCRVSM